MRLKKKLSKRISVHQTALFVVRDSFGNLKIQIRIFLAASNTNNVYIGKYIREARLKWPKIK